MLTVGPWLGHVPVAIEDTAEAKARSPLDGPEYCRTSLGRTFDSIMAHQDQLVKTIQI